MGRDRARIPYGRCGLSGLRVVITGASSGIGEAMVRQYLRRGARVLAIARREDRLRDLVERATRERGELAVAVSDVCDPARLREVVEKQMAEWGTFDVAIANAGISSAFGGSTVDFDDARRISETNYHGMLNLFAAVLPAMQERGSGHLVGIASLAGLRGLPTAPAYSASKAAMQAFLDGLRVRIRRTGVKVTTVNPGFIRSEMTAKNKFRMPFLMDTEAAAELIVKKLGRKPAIIEFPLPMSLGARFLRALPAPLFDVVAGMGQRKR